MCDLAIALHQRNGYHVTGSDDVIFTQVIEKLQAHQLLPGEHAWFPGNLSKQIDFIVVGARIEAKNPELAEAQRLGIPIISCAQLIYQYAAHQQRILCIGGMTSKVQFLLTMMHVLEYHNKPFDYFIDTPTVAQTVRLSDAPIMLLEGDCRAASIIDDTLAPRYFQHHTVVFTPLHWRVSPPPEVYSQWKEGLTALVEATPKGGSIIYDDQDELIQSITQTQKKNIGYIPYHSASCQARNDKTFLKTDVGEIPIAFHGEENMRIIAAAKVLAGQLGITETQFYTSLASLQLN